MRGVTFHPKQDMKKRLIFFIVTALAILLLLSACGEKTGGSTKDEAAKNAATGSGVTALSTEALVSEPDRASSSAGESGQNSAQGSSPEAAREEGELEIISPDDSVSKISGEPSNSQKTPELTQAPTLSDSANSYLEEHDYELPFVPAG